MVGVLLRWRKRRTEPPAGLGLRLTGHWPELRAEPRPPPGGGLHTATDHD